MFSKKIITIITSFLFNFSIPTYANDCVDHITEHLKTNSAGEVTLNLDNCNMSGQGLYDAFYYLNDHSIKITRLSLVNSGLNSSDGNNLHVLSKRLPIFADQVYLDLSHNPLYDFGINEVMQVSNLIEINLTDTGMTSASANNIGFIPTIKTLILNWNNIDDEGCFRITTATKATRFEIAHNQLVDTCAGYLGYNQHIREFDGSYNKIGDEGATCLGNAHLTKLNLEGNQITNEGAYWLAYSQFNVTTLTDLNVANNKISNQGIRDLLGNQYFIRLNVSNNSFDDKGLAYGTNAVSLKSLKLDGNHITDKGLAALLRSTQLNEIYLNHIKLTSTSVQRLANTTSLQAVFLNNTGLTDYSVTMLARNTNIHTLDLTANQIGSLGAIALATKPNITTLRLANNNIYDTGAIALANHSFDELNVSNNQIGAAGVTALLAAQTNGTIKSLYVSDNPN